MAQYGFEVSYAELKANPDLYVSAIFAALESDFLIMPKGQGFIEYPVFEQGYEVLKQVTENFRNISLETIYKAAVKKPVAIIVLRSMLGFTPPEWAYMASRKTARPIDQGFIRNLDRKIRMAPLVSLKISKEVENKLKQLISVACELLVKESPKVLRTEIHRLDKADTKRGIVSIKNLANIGAPYAMLLYERFLGRPFAGHRDSVSELIGDKMESAIEEVLAKNGVSFRKTKRAEKIQGFDQAPDFIIPSEFNPEVIIEAKITEDDGTARDKVTRIQHLGELSLKGRTNEKPKFEVIACIGGRGFGIRREDMRKMLLATRGKVFTFKTLNYLVSKTNLKNYKTNKK